MTILGAVSSSGEQPRNAAASAVVRYAAIGDSYSIGEGASPGESWPALLARHLSETGIQTELVANPSKTGWTSQQAIDEELPVFAAARPTFATLLIGVNDWVQGVDATQFRTRVAQLLDAMLKILADKRRLLVVTIPDFSATPKGGTYARGRDISQGLAEFNKIVTEEAVRRDLRVVDIFPMSKKVRDDPSLVAPDGLHPSAKEYARWEETIFPVARELLQN